MQIIRFFSLLIILLLSLFIQTQAQNKEVFKRVVSARAFFNKNWVIKNETASTCATVLADLKPSYISGLLYFNAQTLPSDAHRSAWDIIKTEVFKTSPNCKFDITINPNEYKKPDDIVAKMKAINELIQTDIWYLDFMAGPYKSPAKVLQAAIDYAHSQGQLIGANEGTKSILEDADFVVIHDGRKIDVNLREEIKDLVSEYQKPFLFQINNDSDRSDDDTIHTFMKKWKDYERIAHIKRLSRNQASWKYRFMYPVYFPVYLHKEAYNAAKEEKTLSVIKELMKKYN